MPAAVPYIMMAMAAASTAMSISAQNKQADATATAANNAAASDYQQQTLAQEQTNQQSAIDKSERAKQAMMERASLRVAQGESGVSGLSTGRELGAVDMSQSYDTSIMEANRAGKVRQLQYEKEGTYTTAKGRVNMANSQKTSGWQSGLQIGIAGTTGYLQGETMRKQWK